MIGRLDVRPGGPCPNCEGTGKDPKKRTRACPVCFGSKVKLVCQTCGEDMPCSGTESNVRDQAQCRHGRERSKGGPWGFSQHGAVSRNNRATIVSGFETKEAAIAHARARSLVRVTIDVGLVKRGEDGRTRFEVVETTDVG